MGEVIILREKRSRAKNMRREPETKTLYFNETHLKPKLRMKIIKGFIDPYNITFESMHHPSKHQIRKYKDEGYKAVFEFEGKTVLFWFNK